MGHGFTSNGRENSVTVFDRKMLKELQRIPVGKNLDAILYDAKTSRVFTFNGSSNGVTALDSVSGKLLRTIAVGGKPEFSVTDEQGMISCNIEDKSGIVAIDAKTLTVKNHWPIAPGEEPSGLAFDKKNRRLFAVCGNKKMAIVDADSGKVLATPTLGDGSDASVFDPASGLAFRSNGQDGTLTLVHEESTNTFHAAGTVTTQRGARTMALNPRTHRIYLITAAFKPAAPGGGSVRRGNPTPLSFSSMALRHPDKHTEAAFHANRAGKAASQLICANSQPTL